MKMKTLLSLIAGSCFLATANTMALTIDFSGGYAPGDLLGQPGTGTQWIRTNAPAAPNIIEVAAGVGAGGTQGIRSVSTGAGSNFVFYGFNTTNADLGFAFDSGASVLEYSFQWRPTQALDASDSPDIFRFSIGSSTNIGDSAAVRLTVRANGAFLAQNGGSALVQHALFQADVYSTISGTIDYGSKTYTVFVDGTQLFDGTNGGDLAFENAAADNVFIRLGNLSAANPDYRAWSMDNISIIPEPATYAAFFGLLAIGIVLLNRRRRA